MCIRDSLITDARSDASAYWYVRADPLGDLRADAACEKTTKAPTLHHHYRQHRTD